jgi:16S rRNA (cytosine967-C5)-methyltransferase
VAAVVFEGRSSDDALRSVDDSPERAAVRAISLGSIRWYLRLGPVIHSLLSKPQGVADQIRALLVAAAHQVEYSRNAPQASVHAAVDAARILGLGRSSGLVNAILRRFVAERATLLERVDQRLAARVAHPQWLVELLEQAWPDSYESILKANNEHPPLVLRVDLSRMSLQSYREQLDLAGIAAEPIDWAPAALGVNHPVAVGLLPGFKEGRVSVQDAGAQLAAHLLDAQPGMRVLDACAAPGGKTGHLLEHTSDLAELVAVDLDSARAARIEENLQRLGRKATVVRGDVRDPGASWRHVPFERILVDAPCSGTGVIRRHPDIKLLRRPADIGTFATAQIEIVRAAYAALAPSGRLLYSTCSVLPAENEAVIRQVLNLERSARAIRLPGASMLAPGARDCDPGIQLLPGAQAGSDGFYYACLEKTTSGT